MHGVIDETDNLKWLTPFESGKPANGQQQVNGWPTICALLANKRPIIEH